MKEYILFHVCLRYHFSIKGTKKRADKWDRWFFLSGRISFYTMFLFVWQYFILRMKKKSKLQNPIHRSKSILVLIHLNRFISNPNPYFWILNPIHLIGYGLNMDWIHFWIIQIAFWVGFWLGPIQVEPKQSGSRLSKVGPSPRQAESSGPNSNRVGMG